jgi:hypothetical protein
LRVLFLTHRLPYAPNRGDRVRAYHLLKALAPHAQIAGVARFRLVVHERQEIDLRVRRQRFQQVIGTHAIAAVRRVGETVRKEQDSQSHA